MITVYVVADESRACYRMVYEDPLTGKQVKKTTKVPLTGNRRDAERVAGDWERDLNAGGYSAPRDVTWKMFRERIKEELFARVAKGTAASYSVALNAVETYLGTPILLESLDGSQLSKLHTAFINAGLTVDSVDSYFAEIRACLQWAIDAKLLAKLPAFPKKKVKRGKGKSKGRPITLEEFERMLMAIPKGVTAKKKKKTNRPPSSRKKATPLAPKKKKPQKPTEVSAESIASWDYLLRGLWLSGLRIGEAVRLYWSQPRGIRDAIVVDMSGPFPMFSIPADGQKNRERQLLPIAPEFVEFLENTPQDQRHGRVFRILGLRKDANNKPIEIRGLAEISRRVADIGEAANVMVDMVNGKWASAHDLRRSFGHRWATRVLPQILQKMMRHASIETTLTYYVGNLANETAEKMWEVHNGTRNGTKASKVDTRNSADTHQMHNGFKDQFTTQ